MNSRVKFSTKFTVLFMGIVFLSFFECDLSASMTKVVFSEQSLNRRDLEREANSLVRLGQYEAAIAKYKSILQSDLIVTEDDKMTSVGSLTKLYVLKKDYGEALLNHQWVVNRAKENVKKYGFNNGAANLLEREIIALKGYQESGNSLGVEAFIDLVKKEDARSLPPNGVSTLTVSRILRLYDTIGDASGGITFIDEILTYFKIEVEKRGETFVLGGFHNEYLAIREAFEKDKAEGTKGRATRALIQSNYFPWI